MGDSSRILVVDDSPTQADYLRGLLEERGYEVAVSRNGELALEAVRESHPGLIISDIVMPVMNGYDLCRAVKQDPALRDTPVMLVTTLDDPADLILGLNARADAYLTKPYSPEYLLSRVEALFSQTRSVESPRDPVEVTLRGHDYAVTSSRKQILELLVSTYENAIQQNHKLVETQLDLEALHKHLDRDRRLLRTLIDTLPDRIYIKDAQSRYILDNWAHLHFIGLSSTAEIVGKTADRKSVV